RRRYAGTDAPRRHDPRRRPQYWSGRLALVTPGRDDDTEGMMDGGRPPGASVDAVERATRAATTARTRLPHLDNLRTVMIAWIIGGHAPISSLALGGRGDAE